MKPKRKPAHLDCSALNTQTLPASARRSTSKFLIRTSRSLR